MNASSNAPTRHPAKPPAGEAAAIADAPLPSLAIQPGDRVQIFQIKAFHRPFIEGSAVVIAAIPGTPGVFYVRFDDDTQLRRRKVLPGVFQSSPESALEVLLTAWRAGDPMEKLTQQLAGAVQANDNQKER